MYTFSDSFVLECELLHFRGMGFPVSFTVFCLDCGYEWITSYLCNVLSIIILQIFLANHNII